MTIDSNFHLYTAGTPNGIKVSILLEELNIKYQWTKIDFSKKEQKEQWFLDINPNGRIPAAVDKMKDGQPLRLWESGSIMQYLVETYDNEHKYSYPRGSREYWEVNHWLFFQVGGIGPMQGQTHHFLRYAAEKMEYGINRYQNETRRLYRVLDEQLQRSKSGFLVGDRLTIADIANWGWVKMGWWAGIDLEEYPALSAWVMKLLARPAFQKGRAIPEPPLWHDRPDNLAAAEALEKEGSSWILNGQADDGRK